MSSLTSPGQSAERRRERARSYRRRQAEAEGNTTPCTVPGCGWPCRGLLGLAMHLIHAHKGDG